MKIPKERPRFTVGKTPLKAGWQIFRFGFAIFGKKTLDPGIQFYCPHPLPE
jgi:hypothetical protein